MSALADDTLSGEPHVAIVAVGSYGRAEMSPHSDVDVLLLSSAGAPSSRSLKALLHPLWDAGLAVGHALVTPKQAIARAATDLDAATSLLDGRLVWGDPALFDELQRRRATWLARDARRLGRRIIEASRRRHRTAERAGWALAPDLKDDVGGLRDIQVVAWMAAALALDRPLPHELTAGRELLLAVREALHAEVTRKNDRLHMELQPAVARRLGLAGSEGTDELMTGVHSTARRIEHVAAVTIGEITDVAFGGPRRSGSIVTVDDGIFVEEGALVVTGEELSVERALRVLAANAHTGKPPSRRTITRLEGAFTGPPVERWTAAALDAFLNLLEGAHASGALELLDHVNGWSVLLPEWQGIRGRAQHDPYHRYTVDGHSFLTVEEVGRAVASDPVATIAADELGDLRALRLAALLHDVGKGSGEDHARAGERIARAACRRMSVEPETADDVATAVQNHLLLTDTAARRDLDDGAVIEEVVKRVRTQRHLRLLYILSVADGRATGPHAWNDWKAALVRELFRKTMYALQTGEVPVRSDIADLAARIESYEPALAGRAAALLTSLPHSYLGSAPAPDMADELKLLARDPRPGEIAYRIDPSGEDCAAVIVCVRDRPGVLARTAGVLALERMSVMKAQAYSSTTGVALQRFVVRLPAAPRWERFGANLAAAYSGRLALDARLKRKALDYHPGAPVVADVRVLQDASPHSSVVEVRARDALGLLYAIASGLADLDIDIHAAKIDTRGERVVDVFYARTVGGTKLSEGQLSEVVQSIEHKISQLLG